MGEENQNIDPILNGQTSNSNVTSGGNVEKKGKKKIVLLIIAILLVVAIAAGLVYYFTIYTKPDRIYKRLIQSTIDSYTDELKDMEYKTSKTSFKLDADIDTDEIEEDITDLINKIDIGVEVQSNNEEKQLLMNLQADYEEEDLLDFQMYCNIEEEKAYMQLENLLNKYIEVEDVDDEFYSILSEALENQKMTAGEKVSLQKAMEIIKKELTNVIKKEYCSAQKEEITVNGKTVSTTKNILKMNTKQLKDECTTVLKNLKDNEEFINCFEEKDEVSEMLENSIEQFEDLDTDDESTMEIAIYTEGFMQKVAKFTLTVKDSDETVTMAFTKTAENTYDFEISTQEDTVCTGILTLEEKNDEEGVIQLEINIPDFGKLKLNIEYSQKFNENIDIVDVTNSVKADELTDADQQTLVTNLQKSKLYELIESFSGKSSNLIGNTTVNYDYDYDDDDDDTTANVEDNAIITYDDKLKIIFTIPAGYELGYTSENYKSLEKDDISIKVSSTYGDKDTYYESLQENKEYYEEEADYKNVQLSDMQTMEVNGKTFYYATFSYEYSSSSYTTKYETKYVWSEVSGDNVVDFEIRGAENITTEELNELLTIEVEKN